jgi:hypothetical protein
MREWPAGAKTRGTRQLRGVGKRRALRCRASKAQREWPVGAGAWPVWTHGLPSAATSMTARPATPTPAAPPESAPTRQACWALHLLPCFCGLVACCLALAWLLLNVRTWLDGAAVDHERGPVEARHGNERARHVLVTACVPNTHTPRHVARTRSFTGTARRAHRAAKMQAVDDCTIQSQRGPKPPLNARLETGVDLSFFLWSKAWQSHPAARCWRRTTVRS